MEVLGDEPRYGIVWPEAWSRPILRNRTEGGFPEARGGSKVDLATFCAGPQVSSQPPTHTASGADALTTLRLPDPGMEKFYRRLMGALLARRRRRSRLRAFPRSYER